MENRIQEKYHITSSPEEILAEMLTKDERVDPFYFIEHFLTLKVNAENKTLHFVTLKELWKSGIAMKRYLEYPNVELHSLDTFFEEINTYIRKSAYLIHFINGIHEKEKYIQIRGISMEMKKVRVISWEENGQAIDREVSFTEYYQTYIETDHSRDIVRIDIYEPISNRGRKHLDRNAILKIVENGILSSGNILCCLWNRHTYNSAKVLCEWFQIFENTVAYLLDHQLLNQDVVIDNNIKELFEVVPDKVSMAHLYRMMKTYNWLLGCMKKSIVGDSL